ncbi:hypothetical protein FHS31_001813 [Sphingomonas vulcanisoli]|uniref:Uncharacterized protein n=1 Tax=Sphingomonas vulcanisoli TaxID=1658060 RepID=A0ABX0TRW3_9SPHN|nr:hypothetical protein [Sphingomonas vulcanisoli]
MIDIVHRGTADAAIIPGEPHWLDQIDRRAKARAKPQHGANIPGNFRLEEGDAHPG